MSLTSSVPDEAGIIYTALGHDCFYCGAALSDPAVHWSGFSAEIYLHPTCVFPLFIRISRDLHELDCPAYYRRRRDSR